jgi:hypothetical protein
LLNACPKVIAEAIGQLLITGVPLAMVMVTLLVAEPKLLDATTLLEVAPPVVVPAVVGVPYIDPLELRFSHASDAPHCHLEKVIGAIPEAAKLLVKLTPTVPLKELVEVKTGAEPTVSAATSLVTLP